MVKRPGHPERDAEIVRIWNNSDLTYEQIGKQFGISRRAVGGVVYRAGDQAVRRGPRGPRSKTSHARPEAKTNTTKPLPPPRIMLDEPEPIGPVEDFPEMGHCRYTQDDISKPGWRMCGHKKPDNTPKQYPWCEFHAQDRVKDNEATRRYNERAAAINGARTGRRWNSV